MEKLACFLIEFLKDERIPGTLSPKHPVVGRTGVELQNDAEVISSLWRPVSWSNTGCMRGEKLT